MSSRTQDLAAELRDVIRLAARDPEALEGRLPALSSLHRVVAAGELDESARVHFILHRLIPDVVARLPAGRDCRAIRELMTWEDADGEAQSLTTRYHRASAHLVNAATDFGRRQEPRLLAECARRILTLDQEDRLAAATVADGAAGAIAEPPDALLDDPALSPLAPLLWTRAERDHQRRLSAIRGGVFSVSNQEEMLDLLLTMTQAARHSIHAVDRTDLERWFGNARMQHYLDAQLERARAGTIRVERLRFIRRERLLAPRERNLLREFIRLHDEAGATLLLCPEDPESGLQTGFDSRMFMVLVDVDSTPACLTAWLGESGYIERSLVYLRDLDPVRTHHADMLRVKEHVTLNRFNESIRAYLAGHDDPPLSDDDVVARPVWSPIARPDGALGA
ncbi:MAG: hypothetical protein QOE11_2716 [Solirubrobacteraceae bacterium]|jgi:hypothetical protein|nr:hypothetical protein [Solirubrobacteraceae bacterium]